MDFTRNRINIITRIILILGLSWVAFMVMFRTDYWTLSIWILIVVIFLVISLIRFFEKSSRHLYRFISSIKSSDFSPTFFLDNKSEIDNEMNRIYNEISAVFRNLRDEREFHYQYLQLLIEHVNIAIVCFTDSFEVQFSNQAAFDLFGRPYFHNLTSFERINTDISNAIKKVKRGKNQLVKVVLKDELCLLTVSSAEFRFHDREYKLVTFYNIKPEMERQELESWKKLIRTLTHEVNNSAIPITNLTHYVSGVIVNDEGKFNDLTLLNHDQEEDLKTSLLTIEKRSDGLVSFINSTRNFTRTLKPDFKTICLKELFDRVFKLLSENLNVSGIKTVVEINPVSLETTIDPVLFEQVIINLILNSIEALKKAKEPEIIIKVHVASKQTIKITIADNGRGINKEDLGNIFVPYFTTKANGSGLGLSICRNIIDLHKGQISVNSSPGSGTLVTILV
jgi:two-component system, NtrC family, nitrogen regulation sensor histidine kinase NtrY